MLGARHVVVPEIEQDQEQLARPVKFEGTVTEVSDDGKAWTIAAEEDGDLVVTIDENTAIVGLAAGESPVDRRVEGRAVRQADGTLLAKVLRVERD
jgi:hypothetical protein